MPIPHNGPRGSLETDTRHAPPLSIIATAAEALAGTVTDSPFTVMTTTAAAVESLNSLIVFADFMHKTGAVFVLSAIVSDYVYFAGKGRDVQIGPSQ